MLTDNPLAFCDFWIVLGLIRWAGRMGGMPRRTRIPDLTGEALSAHRVIQNESRLVCLRFLLGVPSASRAEITRATGLAITTTIDALSELEERGYVTATVPAEDRSGRHPRYTVNRERTTTELLAFVSWLLG